MIDFLLNALPRQDADEKIMMHFLSIFHDVYHISQNFNLTFHLCMEKQKR